MIKSQNTTSKRLAGGKTPASPIAPPQPTGPTARRVPPNPISTFTNEHMPDARLGSVSVNPGKRGGK